MSIANRVNKEFQAALNTITSSPMDWEEITVLITVRSYAEGATLVKRMEWDRKAGIWVPYEKPTESAKST